MSPTKRSIWGRRSGPTSSSTSPVAPGTNVILYNDAPAPMPGFDPRYDYYSGDPDQTAGGGAYQTLPGLWAQHPDHHAIPGSGNSHRRL